MRAYARAGRRGEALRQYKSCAETLKRELGVAPEAETQALASEIARSGSVRGNDLPNDAAEDRNLGPLVAPASAPERRVPARPEASPSEVAGKLGWPCLLPNIAVAVTPVRNLTGDPAQNYLVEAFTDDLVTDLLRHGRGISLKPLGDERGTLSNGNRSAERLFDYIVTGSAQSSAPGLLRSTCGSPTRRHPSFSGPVGMNSSPKTSLRSKRGLLDEFLASCTCCCFRQQVGVSSSNRACIWISPSVFRAHRML